MWCNEGRCGALSGKHGLAPHAPKPSMGLSWVIVVHCINDGLLVIDRICNDPKALVSSLREQVTQDKARCMADQFLLRSRVQ